MKSILLLCGALGSVSDASECQADENSLLQARKIVRKQAQSDLHAVLAKTRGVAKSLLEGSDTTMTSDEVDAALDAASNALAVLSPAIRQQVEHAQQQINDAAEAVRVCHGQAQDLGRSEDAVREHAAAVEGCRSTLDHLRTAEREQCGIAEDCLCDEARVRTTDQEALCTSMTETYEATFCEHHSVCTMLHRCHSSETVVFTLLQADVEAEMALVVQEYVAVEQSRCLTGLIREAMTPPRTPISHAALTACDDVDSSAIAIDFPTLPAEPRACPAPEHGRPGCVDRDRLSENERLASGERLVSPGGTAALAMQGDGNLCLRHPPDNPWPVWCLNGHFQTRESVTSELHSGSHLIMQRDGNLVIYSPNHVATWRSITHGTGAVRAQLYDDCRFEVSDSSGQVLWSLGTRCGPNILMEGEMLAPGQRLVSPGGAVTIAMQGDGNLCMRHPPDNPWPVWCLNGHFQTRESVTSELHSGSRLIMQRDGNLVIYTPDNVATWRSITHGTGAVRAQLYDDCRFEISDSSDEVLWSLGSSC